jgi:uridine phosphorylase
MAFAVVHLVRGVPAAEPLHLRPAAELAERVLLPGDPARALAVATDLMDKPVMFNHARGLWGYTGAAADGELLTVQATGMGGPSAAIVVEELIALGARTLVRIGTCGAFDRSLELGQLLAVAEALPADGTSTALGSDGPVAADAVLTAALAEQAGRPAARVVSSDLFYDEREQVERGWLERGVAAVEMEAATVLRLAELRGVRAGCLLAVSDLIGGGERQRLDADALLDAGLELGRAAYAALATR